ESTNETGADLGLDVDQLRGEQFGRLFRELLTREDAIVDVGASNIEDFLTHMMRYEGAHEEMSYFVLPVINTGKAQRETIKTVAALAALGVDPERVRILFNRVDSSVEEEFPSILAYAAKSGEAPASPQAAVYEHEGSEPLADQRTTIAAVLADQTDYRALLRSADPEDHARISQLSNRHALRALAKPVDRQMNAAFAALFS